MGAVYFFPSWRILIFLSEHLLLVIIKSRNFLGGPVVKNLYSSAGDMGSIPDLGTGIPHAAEKPSPRATTTDLMLWSLLTATREARAPPQRTHMPEPRLRTTKMSKQTHRKKTSININNSI